MSTISRELRYLNAKQQVEDTRRLRSVWEHCSQRERTVRRLPWLLRSCAGCVGLLWLAVAPGWLGPLSALCGLLVLGGGWAAAEWRFRAGRATLPLGWELDRLNPQYEGAFSLLELIDGAEPPVRAQFQPVLEITLARIDWNRPFTAPDRAAEKRRAAAFASGLGVAAVLGLLLILLHTPAAAQPETPEPGCSMKPIRPAVAASPRTPQIKDFRVRIEPPAYTRLPIQENFLTTIQAPTGSKITLAWRVESDGPVQTWIQHGDRQVSAVVREPIATAEIATTQPTGACAIIAQSGAADVRLPLFLQWQDDRPPRVETTIAPKIERDREGVRFELHTDDDYGLTRIECIVSTQPNTPGGTVRVEVFPVALPEAQGSRDAFHGRVLIPTAVLDRLKQDRLRLQVKAYDTHTATGSPDSPPAPNVGSSDTKDFLVVQPWDNARKPRSLDRKSGAEGDQNNPSDDNQGGGGGGGSGAQNNQGPRMLQKNPDEPPGPQQSNPGGNGDPAKYSSMAGSQNDTPKNQNDQRSNSGQPPAPPQKDTPPSQQPSGHPDDPQKNQTNPENANGTPSTDGAKNPEPPPPTAAGTPKNAGAGPGEPVPPSSTPPSSSKDGSPVAGNPHPPGNSGTPPGGGGNAGPKSTGRGNTSSNDTDAGARGNARIDDAVTARSSVSVDDALNFARQKPLGAWQRNFGGTGGKERFNTNDSGVDATLPATGAPAGTGVSQAATQAPDTRQHLAAERLRIDQKYSDRIEQYLLRARSNKAANPPTATPNTR